METWEITDPTVIHRVVTTAYLFLRESGSCPPRFVPFVSCEAEEEKICAQLRVIVQRMGAMGELGRRHMTLDAEQRMPKRIQNVEKTWNQERLTCRCRAQSWRVMQSFRDSLSTLRGLCTRLMNRDTYWLVYT